MSWVLFCPILLFGEDSIAYFGPGNRDLPWPQPQWWLQPRNSDLPKLDYTGRDLRGAVIKIDLVDRGPVSHCDFSGADLRGLQVEANFVGTVFREANLSGIVFSCTADFTDANISESYIPNLPLEQLAKTKNYKEKDLSETCFPSYGKVDLAGFNLRNSYFRGIHSLRILEFMDADISGATFQAAPLVWLGPIQPVNEQYKLGNPREYSLSSEQLYSTKTYKERNLGRVIFIYMDFSDADFRNQNLGYFDGCNLEGADLTNAYFCIRDERTLPPFARNNPIGVTDCKITVEQFKQTRNYKIWQDLGIPEVEKILITEDNKREYRYDDELRSTILNIWFGWEMPKDNEPQYVYKVGNVFVTKEIAEMLDAERQVEEKSP